MSAQDQEKEEAERLLKELADHGLAETWRVEISDYVHGYYTVTDSRNRRLAECWNGTGPFIAAAPRLVRNLLAALLSLQDENTRLRQDNEELHRAMLKSSPGKAVSEALQKLSALRDEQERLKQENAYLQATNEHDYHNRQQGEMARLKAELERLKTQLAEVTRIEQEMRKELGPIVEGAVLQPGWVGWKYLIKHWADRLQQVTRA